MVDKHHETQEQSIKARKHQLFEADAPTDVGSGRPFKAFLRETPAAPLSALTRAILWVAGVVVGMVLVAALVKTFHRHSQGGPKPAAKAANVAPAARHPASIVKTCTGPRHRSSSWNVSA